MWTSVELSLVTCQLTRDSSLRRARAFLQIICVVFNVISNHTRSQSRATSTSGNLRWEGVGLNCWRQNKRQYEYQHCCSKQLSKLLSHTISLHSLQLSWSLSLNIQFRVTNARRSMSLSEDRPYMMDPSDEMSILKKPLSRS